MNDLRHPLDTFPELANDVRRLFQELDHARQTSCRALPGECTPEMDLYEAPDRFDICLDVPGITSPFVRVLLKGDVLVIAGEKRPPESPPPVGVRFHLAERPYGRFVRTVRLPKAVDAAGASATLTNGQLRISIPLVEERRGRDVLLIIHTS